MNSIRFIAVFAVLIGGLCHTQQVRAGIALSTVLQDGTKVDYSGTATRLDQLPPMNQRLGSASRIGTFDFEFMDLPGLYFLRARIRFWVQLPPEAIGDLAPYLVFSPVLQGDSPDLDLELISGRAVKTDIRISFDLFPAGVGIVEKQIDFKDLTRAQSSKLSTILSHDPQQRVDVWLASDTLKAITVPKNVSYISVSTGLPTLVVRNLTSTLDLEFVPEPATSVMFGIGLSVALQRSWKEYRRRKSTSSKGAKERC
jgi:hypothetical protein